MDNMQVPWNDQPNNIKDYNLNMAMFKTLDKYGIYRKRMSSFNMNKRRPTKILTIPRKGDNNSNSGSMSSIRSEDNKINIKKYSKYTAKKSKLRGSFNQLNSKNSLGLITQKLNQYEYAQDNLKQQSEKSSSRSQRSSCRYQGYMKRNNQQVKGLVWQESKNYGEIGDSIINRNMNKTVKSSQCINMQSSNQGIFDQSEYDAAAMNEKLNARTKNKVHQSKYSKVFEFQKEENPYQMIHMHTPPVMAQTQKLEVNEKSKVLRTMQKNRSANAVLPESFRVKSQFKVMKGCSSYKNSFPKYHRLKSNSISVCEDVIISSPKRVVIQTK